MFYHRQQYQDHQKYYCFTNINICSSNEYYLIMYLYSYFLVAN